MTGQVYPTPDRLGREAPTVTRDDAYGLCDNEDCCLCRPRASSQAGLGTIRPGLSDRAAFSILDAQAGPEGAPVGSILRTADGEVYRRGRAGWHRLGVVSIRRDTPEGDLIYRGAVS